MKTGNAKTVKKPTEDKSGPWGFFLGLSTLVLVTLFGSIAGYAIEGAVLGFVLALIVGIFIGGPLDEKYEGK